MNELTVACVPPAGWWHGQLERRWLAPGGDGSQLAQRVRRVLGDYCLVGKCPEGSRQPGEETRTLTRRPTRCLVAAALAM
jgi:hypothetical protein